MCDAFGQVYSNLYDELYRDKNYTSECDLLEEIFRRYCKIPVKTVLDLGCGTGNYAIPLAKRGLKVTGVDYSRAMLAIAQDKIRSKELSLELYEADIRHVNLDKKFDVALMMFAVLGYQLENRDVLAALRAAHRHIYAGGLLVFDVWYGPAVLANRPSDRLKVISTSNGKVLRSASGNIDTRRQICTVKYHLWQLIGSNLSAETDEEHRVRFFFPLELEFFLEISGFTLIHLGAFPDFEKDPGEDTWNVTAIARAV